LADYDFARPGVHLTVGSAHFGGRAVGVESATHRGNDYHSLYDAGVDEVRVSNIRDSTPNGEHDGLGRSRENPERLSDDEPSVQGVIRRCRLDGVDRWSFELGARAAYDFSKIRQPTISCGCGKLLLASVVGVQIDPLATRAHHDPQY